jgi:DNA-binding NarL/FixJ family response regulator
MRILLIDDHALFRAGLQELLERRGINVIGALGDCEEGIARAEAETPDVVLLDMRMPDMNGIEVLSVLRDKGLSMPIAMLTTSREESDIINSLQGGAQGYLLKDMEPDELITALRDIVGGTTVVAKELTAVLAKAVHGPERLLGSDAEGTRDSLPSRRGPEQQGHRPQSRYLRRDGEIACKGHPAQAGCALPCGGGGDRGGAESLSP